MERLLHHQLILKVNNKRILDHVIFIISEATPTVELPVPTSPQFESSVVYVKKKSIDYSSAKLRRMIGDLREVYLDNMYHTEKSFRSIDVSEVIDFVQDYIALLLSPRFRKIQMIESIKKEFEHVKTMKQLFKALRKYVSWFNFEIVVKLVNTFITDERDLQRKWSTYREKLKDYFKNNNFQAVQIVDSIDVGLSDVPGTKVMIATVDRDDYTLNDLYFFHKLIADALEVPEYNFYFCAIEDDGGPGGLLVKSSSSKGILKGCISHMHTHIIICSKKNPVKLSLIKYNNI